MPRPRGVELAPRYLARLRGGSLEQQKREGYF